MKNRIFILLIISLKYTFSKIYNMYPSQSLEEFVKNITVQPGDIIKLHKGIFTSAQICSNLFGTKENHITIKGEKGVIVENSFYLSNDSYVDLIGPIEIRNTEKEYVGSGIAVRIFSSEHILIQNLYIHHVYANGIAANGNDIIIRDNRIFEVVRMNVNNTSNSWGQCISAEASNALIENNTVENCWGEGIDLLYCHSCIARYNVVKNAHSVMIYTDNSYDLLIDSNILFIDRFDFNKGNNANAFGIGTETHGHINATNITFRNNLAISCGNSFNKIGRNGYYADIYIVHNTFYNSTLSLQFDFVNDSSRVKNIYLANNILVGSQNIIDGTINMWTAHSNLWFFRPGVYAVYLKDSPGYENTSEYIVNEKIEEILFPKLINNPYCMDPDCYLPRCLEDIEKDKNKTYGNLLLNKGIYTKYSDYDFYGRIRNKINPTIGFSEFCYGIKSVDDSMSVGLQVFITILIIVIIIIVGYFGFKLYKRYKIKKSEDDDSYVVSSLM